MGRRHLLITGRTGLAGTRSPAQGVVGTSCKAHGQPSSSNNQVHRPGEDGGSSPGGGRRLLQGLWGAISFREPGALAWGGPGVQPRGCLEPPARPMGGHYLRRTGRTGLGGTGSPAQGVFGASCQAYGGPPSSENRAHRPGGDGESSPGGVWSLLPGLRGAIFFREPGAPARGGRGVLPRGCSEPPARPRRGHLLQRTGRTGLGGTGSPAQGVFGASCQANGGPISLENRAHRPGGDGESSPVGVRSLLPGLRGAIFFREPGAPAQGGTGSPAQGLFGASCQAFGGRSSSENRAQRPGGTGSPAQGVFGASCQAYGGPPCSENRPHRPGGDGESSPGGVWSLLSDLRGAIFFREPGAPAQGGRGVLPRGCSKPPARPRGAIFFREPGAPAWGGRGVQPRGCSEPPARPMGGQYLRRTGRTGLGGTGSEAQGVFGASCQTFWGPSSSENRAHRPGGDGGSCPGGVWGLLPGLRGAIFLREPGAPAWGGRGAQPRGCSEPPARPTGGHLLQRTGRTGPGGTGGPAQGGFGASCQAFGGPSSSENRAHRPGGDGESSPGGVRSLLPGLQGATIFGEPGAPARGGRGVLPRGCSEPPAGPFGGHLLQRTGRTGPWGTGSPAQGVFGASCQANAVPISSENRAHWPWGDGESCPGGVRSLLPGQWGAIFFREPGAPARGGRGVLPRGCSESPARPMGGPILQRTGRTGPGGTGSPAQGVLGASCQANWGPSSSETPAHRPGGDGESCPGGVRSLLPGQGGAIFFREPGAPARGGRESCPGGVRSLLPGPWGAIFLREPGAPARGGTGGPAQGVFGVFCQANRGPSSSENRAQAQGGQGVLPRGCSESPARPMGGHLLPRTGRTGPGGTGSPAQGVFGVSCQANGGPYSSENRAHRPGGDVESCPGGVRSLLPGQREAIFFRDPGTPAQGGTGSPAQGVFGVSCQAKGGPSSSENRAHRPGGDGSPAQGVFGVSCQANGGPSSSENRAHWPEGDGESCPGGVRSLLPGQWGAIFFREPGAGPGGTGSPAQGVFGVSCQANGGPSSSEIRAHRSGGDGESCPGGVRSLLPGQWGAIFFREPGAPARGGRGVLPRGCSESPARPRGGHLLWRTGRTGLGGTGSPAQGVFGASGRTHGYSLLSLSISRQVSRQYRGS